MRKELSVLHNGSECARSGNNTSGYFRSKGPEVGDYPYSFFLPNIRRVELRRYATVIKPLLKLESEAELNMNIRMSVAGRNYKVKNHVKLVHSKILRLISYMNNIFDISYCASKDKKILAYDFNNGMFTICVEVYKRSVLIYLRSNYTDCFSTGMMVATQNEACDIDSIVFALIQKGLNRYNDRCEIHEDIASYELEYNQYLYGLITDNRVKFIYETVTFIFNVRNLLIKNNEKIKDDDTYKTLNSRIKTIEKHYKYLKRFKELIIEHAITYEEYIYALNGASSSTCILSQNMSTNELTEVYMLMIKEYFITQNK